MSAYPVVLLPTALREALASRLTPEPFPEPPPRREDFPPELSAGKSLVSTLYGALGLHKQASELLAPARRQAKRRYEEAVTEFKARRAEHDRRAQAALTPERLRQHVRARVSATLEATQRDAPGDSAAPVGQAERHLYEALRAHFGDLIQRRRRLRAGGAEYHPDFMLHDPRSGLRVDIELDEPYSLGRRLPTHELGSDDARDQAFLAAGWVVVRFAEQQVVHAADGCARVIADLLHDLTGRGVPERLQHVAPCPAIPRWTRAQANEWAAGNTRAALLAQLPRYQPEVREAPSGSQPFQPSAYQRAVFEFLAHGRGHGLVVAVAGSGKSRTIVEGVRVIDRAFPGATTLLLAFNKAIQGENKQKLRDAGLQGKAVSQTLNGYGLSALNLTRAVSVLDNKEAAVLQRAAQDLGIGQIDRETFDNLKKLHGLFQSYGHLDPANEQHLAAVVEQYNLRALLPYGPLIARSLEVSAQWFLERGLISLDDMCDLPVRLGLPQPTYDFVFVDECQDLTRSQLDLVLRAAGPTGRVLFVGDPAQAIMGFRGADNDSVRNILALDPRPTELPLSVTYRCPRAHVQLARQEVPALEAAPGAKEGRIARVNWAQALDEVREGDLLFARRVSVVQRALMELIARGWTIDYTEGKTGKSATDEDEEVGSDHARGVVKAVRKAAATFQPGGGVPQRPRLGPRDSAVTAWMPWLLARLHDASSRWDGGSFEEYVRAVTQPDPTFGVRVASAHQSKGLEARRVFVLAYDLLDEARPGQLAWQRKQERNLKYVALTRSKDTLFLVSSPGD